MLELKLKDSFKSQYYFQVVKDVMARISNQDLLD